jgi:hypothetical protein
LGVYHGLRRKNRNAAFATPLRLGAMHLPVKYKMLKASGSAG